MNFCNVCKKEIRFNSQKRYWYHHLISDCPGAASGRADDNSHIQPAKDERGEGTRARDAAQEIVIESSKAAGYADSTWLDGNFKHELTNRITAALLPIQIERKREIFDAGFASVQPAASPPTEPQVSFGPEPTAATAALEQELDLLLRRAGELGLDDGFSSHYQHGFEMFRSKMQSVIKARIAAIGDDKGQDLQSPHGKSRASTP